MKLTLVLTLLIFPSILAQCNIERARQTLRRSVYEFAIKLTTRVAHETENHFILSPLSLWNLIATLSEGADDKTYDEIKKTLRLHPHLCFNRKYYDIIKEVYTTGAEADIKIASLLVFDESLGLKTEFKNKVERLGLTEVLTPSFKSFDDTVAVINSQVYQSSNGAITEVLSAEDFNDQFVMLVDALSFAGKWKYNFNAEEDEMSTFYDDKLNVLGDVNLMFTTGKFNYTAIPQINAKVLEIPYEAERFSMLIILPDQESTVPSVLDSLRKISLGSIFSLFAESSIKQVMTQIPKFNIESNLENLNELLRDMGLTQIFSPDNSFPDISDYPIYVSDVKQKVELNILDEGAELSPDLFEIDPYSERVEFNANRPFVFMVVDKVTQLPIFVGAYSKPTYSTE